MLALEWLWAHLGTLAAVAFGLAVLYDLSQIWRIALEGANETLAKLTKLEDAIEDLGQAVEEVKGELADLRLELPASNE